MRLTDVVPRLPTKVLRTKCSTYQEVPPCKSWFLFDIWLRQLRKTSTLNSSCTQNLPRGCRWQRAKSGRPWRSDVLGGCRGEASNRNSRDHRSGMRDPKHIACTHIAWHWTCTRCNEFREQYLYIMSLGKTWDVVAASKNTKRSRTRVKGGV